MVQVKDITDEMIYEAIDKKNEAYENYKRQCITDYDQLTDSQKMQAGLYLMQLRLSGMKGMPEYPDKNVWDYIDAPFKVVWRKMEKMVDQNKLEYGTSLRTSWRVERASQAHDDVSK